MSANLKPCDVLGALACLRCGVATPPDQGSHPEGLWDVGWPPRCCERCLAVIRGAWTQQDAVETLREILGEHVDDADPDARQVVSQTVSWYLRYPTSSAFDPGTNRRWAHVSRDVVLDRLQHARTVRGWSTVRYSPTGQRCGGCGVATSTAWRMVTMRAGTHGLSPLRQGPICADCSDLARVHGVGPSLVEALAAAGAPRGITGKAMLGVFGFIVFAAVESASVSGGERRFDYLAGLPGGDPRERAIDDRRRAGSVTAADVRGPQPDV